MKNTLLMMICIVFSLSGFGQYKEIEASTQQSEGRSGGFKKENLFTGGGVLLSLSNYNFGVGVSPVLGYSFNRWFDAGIGLNFTYVSAREVYDDGFNYYTTGNKIHQTDIAPVVFVRAYPLKFLFAQAQLEHNFISQKYKFASGSPSEKYKVDASSLLLGVGYCGGRQDVGDFFYYVSLSVDVLKNKYSPYVQVVQNSVNILPILRAGIQIPLFGGNGGGGRNRDDD